MSPNRFFIHPDSVTKERESQQDSELSPVAVERRLAALRRDMPEALVQIDAVRSDDTAIAVKATIGLPGGARHSAIAAEDVNPDQSWAEQLAIVQAIAITKALDGLGYQSQTSIPARPAEQPSVQAPSPSDDDHLPEYSWNAFWQTMNSRNITREQVQQALGKSVQEATPKEAVEALKSAGILT